MEGRALRLAYGAGPAPATDEEGHIGQLQTVAAHHLLAALEELLQAHLSRRFFRLP